MADDPHLDPSGENAPPRGRFTPLIIGALAALGAVILILTIISMEPEQPPDDGTYVKGLIPVRELDPACIPGPGADCGRQVYVAVHDMPRHAAEWLAEDKDTPRARLTADLFNFSASRLRAPKAQGLCDIAALDAWLTATQAASAGDGAAARLAALPEALIPCFRPPDNRPGRRAALLLLWSEGRAAGRLDCTFLGEEARSCTLRLAPTARGECPPGKTGAISVTGNAGAVLRLAERLPTAAPALLSKAPGPERFCYARDAFREGLKIGPDAPLLATLKEAARRADAAAKAEAER